MIQKLKTLFISLQDIYFFCIRIIIIFNLSSAIELKGIFQPCFLKASKNASSQYCLFEVNFCLLYFCIVVLHSSINKVCWAELFQSHSLTRKGVLFKA